MPYLVDLNCKEVWLKCISPWQIAVPKALRSGPTLTRRGSVMLAPERARVTSSRSGSRSRVDDAGRTPASSVARARGRQALKRRGWPRQGQPYFAYLPGGVNDRGLSRNRDRI